MDPFRLSYILPLKSVHAAGTDFFSYLHWLSPRVELIVVDGSPSSVFEAHAARCGVGVQHLRVDPDVAGFANGKVAGVITGLRRCSHEAVIIADDDVRYDVLALHEMADQLIRADVVRPQNYFRPLPWHAYLDTARMLLNRVSGGDWPGTVGIRRSLLARTGGYDGDVLFENLELVRTITAAGGAEAVPLGLYVRRVPPTTSHYWSQRVRQAYDEFARPVRLAVWLSVAPAALLLGLAGASAWFVPAAAAAIVAAEVGRRRAAGHRVFPIMASLAAPLWITERAACAWLAVGSRLVWGGIRYRGRTLAKAATPLHVLQSRFRAQPKFGEQIDSEPRCIRTQGEVLATKDEGRVDPRLSHVL
jgi:hypothetical protein